MRKEGTVSKGNILLGLSFTLMMVTLYLIFIYAPDVKDTGLEQRIFYFHVPIAIVSYISFLIIFIGSILYLKTREVKWDNLARSSAEIGLIFTALVLITGPIWAKPAWNTWWQWEPRLTTSLILLFIYFAYFIVRSLATDKNRGALFAAVVGIIGFVDVPINYLTIKLWSSENTAAKHPSMTGADSSVLIILFVSMAAMILFFTTLLIYRVSLQKIENDISEAKTYLEETRR